MKEEVIEVNLDLTPSELEHLLQSFRCVKCGHLAVLHTCCDGCNINACSCVLEGFPHNG